jgi:DNA-directed RNA polymerase subunit RPC12/RpoP
MELNDVKTGQMTNVGRVLYAKKGWVKVHTADGDTVFKRAKDLELVDDIMLPVPEKKKITLPPASGKVEWHCQHCDRDVMINPGKKSSVKCPECGAWIEIDLKFNKENYVTGLDVTASGRDTIDIADAIADSLRGMNVEDAMMEAAAQIVSLPGDARFSKANKRQFIAFCKEAGRHDSDADAVINFLIGKYGNLNNGMIRMNLGNLVRGAIRRSVK